MPVTDTNLYRAVHKDSIQTPFVLTGMPKEGLLYPRWFSTSYFVRGEERTSAADVKYATNEAGEEEVQTGGGTSMHDAEGMFGYGFFAYFNVPEGTEYPESLVIRRGEMSRDRTGRINARHYQIEVRVPMTVEALKGALDNFARNAVARQVALAR